MKLIYFSPRPFGMMGTPGTYHLVESLSKLAEVLVIADRAGQSRFDIVHKAGKNLNLHEIPVGKKGYLNQVQKFIDEFKPDAFVIANYAKWFDVAKAVKKANSKVKVILDIKSPLITGTEMLSYAQHPIQFNGIRHAYLLDLVLSRCNEDIDTWLPGVKVAKSLYPLGVKLDQFEPKPLQAQSSTAKKVVFIGSYSKNRKLDNLIKLIYQLPSSLLENFSFDFYGSGPYKETLKSLISELDLTSKVNVFDALPQATLFAKLQEYDVGLGWVPKDIYDAAPSLKALEYIASGLIPLLTSTTGHVRNVTEGFHAVLFDESSQSLQVALEQIQNNEFSEQQVQNNSKRIQRKDWDYIARQYFLPAIEGEGSSELLKNPDLIQQKQVQYESHWAPEVPVFQSTKATQDTVKGLCITGERLYYGLKDEIDYVPLTETGFLAQLNDEADFLLLESCPEAAWGDWHYAYCGQITENLKQLIQKAKELSIPVVFWLTVDFDYRDQYEQICEWVDLVAYADPRYKNWLEAKQNIRFFEMLPAVQSRLFNPLRFISQELPEPDQKPSFLFQGAVKAENANELQTQILKSAANWIGFERNQVPTRNQLRKQNNISSNFASKGKVSYRMLPEILKRAHGIYIADSADITHTELVWQVLENIACRCYTYTQNDDDYVHPILNELEKTVPLFYERPFKKMSERPNQEESLLNEQSVIQAWRYVMANHTYKNRIAQLLEELKLNPDHKPDFPLLTVVSPTKRPEQVQQILSNYLGQTYKHKELVIVVNESFEHFQEIKNQTSSLKDVQVLHMPKDKKAASALNFANQFSNGKFIFRFDDDDYYGSDYLSDAVRFLQIEDAKVLGKFGAYIKVEEVNKVFHRTKATSEMQNVIFEAKELTHSKSAISGATFGVSRELLNQIPFPEESLRTADSAWLEKVRQFSPNTRVLKTDFFQFTVGRQQNQKGHTWSVDLRGVLDKDKEISGDIFEVPR